ncbi:unnamed protein product [Diatraea saccharalis]|uniref:Uncharacterized protein n=1 Tax=Diatraea saccharalis TaxID=40085 RepID=A0A9N9R6B3_9NEOP|nr:unnamed protein product [Diatraea saccharalis]
MLLPYENGKIGGVTFRLPNSSNTAQYERNRSFGHLVHALGRAAGGAKLPSAGLCLNASKAEASLAESGKDMLTVEPRESGGSKQCDFTSRTLHYVRCDVEAHLNRRDRCGRFNTCTTALKVRIYLSSMSGLGIVCRRLPFLAGCCAR